MATIKIGETGDQPEQFAPGTMGCHEALHMAAFLANAVDEELCGIA